MKSPLRIVHLEDNPRDAELIQEILESEGINCQVTRVDTQADFFASIEQCSFDLILADYTLPSFDGLSALKIASEKCPDVPFIFVSGTLGEEVAIEALKIGATDYVLKERLSRIVPSVHRALREAKERAERKRAEALLAGEKRLLEMVAKGNTLSMILDALCRLVEELSKGSLSSILLLDPDGNRLWHGAAPSLPKTYTDAIDGAFIGPAAGSCGTAAYRKEPVIVSDIAQDPLWADYRDLALSHGLRACWSTPVLGSDGRVLGTFAIYSRQPRSPTPQQQNIIEQITNLASIAIERKQAEEERQAHLWFLERMDQTNRAIQGTNDLEQMMSDVLDAVLPIFNCDRAWLVYPCDPEAASWRVPMEHTRPEFPGAFALGFDLPMNPNIAKVFQTIRASSSPVRFGPGSEHPLPAEAANRFGIQSMIGIAIYPKGDKPYMLGLHQCSYPRLWSPQEERLFQEIGRRLEDGLTSLLMFRNLGESERKLEEAQRLTHVGYWERDPDTDLITWSDETYRIYGLQPQTRTLNLAQLPELLHPEDRQIMVQAVAEALRGGRRYDVEYRVVRPNSEVRLVHSQGDVMRDELGRPHRMFGTVQDITERKQAEEALREQASLLDLTHDSVFVRDMNDVITYWNRGAEELYGWTRDEAVGKVSHQLMQTILPMPLEEINAELLRTGRWEGELIHTKRDGTQVVVTSRWSLERDELGNPLAVLETNNDITERKRVERELWRLQLETGRVERLAALGKMTGAIAHELGTPLNSVLGYTQLLAGEDLPEGAQRRVAVIETQIHRMVEIIQHYLSQSRGAAPKMRIHINNLIRETLVLLQPIFQQHGMVVTTALAESPAALFGDGVSLQRVLINLINNAVDASAGNGRINIKTQVSPGAAGEAPGVIIEITDNGAGIPPEILPKIFDLFVTTKPAGKGTGLGLAICQEIIKAHGGNINVASEVGQGTTVQILLPTDANTGESVTEEIA